MSELTFQTVSELVKRIKIPLTSTSPPGLVEADTVDPWTKAGKYSLGWTYFCLILLVITSATRIFHWWTDKLRQALYKEEMEKTAFNYSPDTEYAMQNMPMATARTEDPIFTRAAGEKPSRSNGHSSAISSIGFINDTLALSRWIFYRPIPEVRYWKKNRLSFPSLAVVAILSIALIFVTLWCFLPQPLYWQSIQFGSPPLAIRAGMLGIAMIPWIIGTSVKSNLISFMTGISHERLNVFHRWGGYLLLFLSLIHTIPFYVTPVWDDGGLTVFRKIFPASRGIIYGTGIAALVPLCFLCVHSLPFLRSRAYEAFVVLHVPVAIVFVGMLFWHTNNALTSWIYLWATLTIWLLSYLTRIFKLNWTKPWRNAWLIGDEAAVTLMSENAIKVTIPTQMKWRPGQFVYLRMPGISFFENHPFTIASLCSEDFPSEYGELYRDCTLVFRPYGGFTKKVLNTAIEKGPFQTYRAYLDGPYGGMQRELAAFDTVFLFAGGSGITAIVSQLLELIKRMRDGKAVTRRVEVVWALKRMEALDWFKEELRICREFAPPDSVTCQFYVTAAKRQDRTGMGGRAPRPISNILHDKLDGFVANIASKRNSAYIRDEAQGDPERERELRAENEDGISALPQQKHLQHNVLPPNHQLQQNGTLAREASLRRLEGLDAKPQSSPRFLSPSSAGKSPGRQEFHFPQPSPKKDAPHFQYVPPSPRPHKFEFPQQPQAVHAPYDPAAHHNSPYATNSPSPQPPYSRPESIAQQYFNSPPQNKEENERSTSPYPPPPPPSNKDSTVTTNFPPPPKEAHTKPAKSHNPSLSISIPAPVNPVQPQQTNSNFDFGFPSTPTEFQKNLMRFAFVGSKKKEGWSTEYGRPDIPYMLRHMEVGRRTAIFVCGPPAMRVDVANSVAKMQADIWGDPDRDEIFLHTENYAI